TLEVDGELFPRIRTALFHAQRNAAAVFVDFQNHDFDFFAQGDYLARIHVLVGPIHFGNVHQAFDTGFNFNECTVVGQVGDLAEQASALRVAAGKADPWIFAQLLDAQGDAALFLVELEDLGFDFLTHLQNFGWVADSAPGHVGDVQQAVDAAQVHERTVVGDVLDDALDDGAFGQGFQQLLTLFAHGGFQHGAARQHDVVALAVQLDDLEFQGLAFVWRGVLDGTQVDQRTGQEGADAVGHDGQAALDLAGDGTVDQLAGLERLLEGQPGRQALGAIAGQNGVAIAVLESIDGHGHEIASLDFQLALVVQELFEGDQGLGLQTGVDQNVVVVDAQNFGGDDFAAFQVLVFDAFCKQIGKAFAARCVCVKVSGH